MHPQNKTSVMDAIDQIFAEFDLVFHNQYAKAFPTEEKLNYAKKIWFNNLCHLSAPQIIHAAHCAIRESEFLPTVKGLLKYSYESLGLPDAHSAYIEACQKPSPKAEQQWSHPAVYQAGKESDWFFLNSSNETKAFPIFKQHYERLCERVMNGEKIELSSFKKIPKNIRKPLSSEEKKEKMRQLKSDIGF